MTVALKLDYASESSGGLVRTHIVDPHPQRFWFSKSRAETKNLHF